MKLGNSVRDKMWDYIHNSVWVSSHNSVKYLLHNTKYVPITTSVFNSTTILINDLTRWEIRL